MQFASLHGDEHDHDACLSARAATALSFMLGPLQFEQPFGYHQTFTGSDFKFNCFHPALGCKGIVQNSLALVPGFTLSEKV